jgi:hypothetical protein
MAEIARGGHVERQVGEPLGVGAADLDHRPLVDRDLDPHVPRADALDAGGPHLGLVETPCGGSSAPRARGRG